MQIRTASTFDFTAFFAAVDDARRELAQLHAALNEGRKRQGLTWPELAEQLGCTASRLANLRTARMADMALTIRVTQWLRRPAAEFIHPASSRYRADLL